MNVFGDRVLLRELPADQSVGGIELPTAAGRAHLFLEVVQVGDGIRRHAPGLPKVNIDVAIGDRVFVQFNPMMFNNNMHKVNGERYLAINSHDIIARISAGATENELSVEAFNPVGSWVLVRIEEAEKVGMIYLPNSASPMQSAGEVKLFVEKFGSAAAAELPTVVAGTRIITETSRLNQFRMNRVHYAYIDVPNIVALITE